MIDGLAFGGLPEVAQALAPDAPLVALVHHPLALETGLTPAKPPRLRASERAALACARHVIVDQSVDARLLARRLRGAPTHRRSCGPAPIASRCGTRAWRHASSCSRSAAWCRARATTCWWRRWPSFPICLAAHHRRRPCAAIETARRIDADIARLGLGDAHPLCAARSAPTARRALSRRRPVRAAVALRGLRHGLCGGDRHGLPVVGTRAGAIPETVPASAGVLVPPDDVAALAAGVRRLIENRAERERLAAGGAGRASVCRSWDATARTFSAGVLEGGVNELFGRMAGAARAL